MNAPRILAPEAATGVANGGAARLPHVFLIHALALALGVARAAAEDSGSPPKPANKAEKLASGGPGPTPAAAEAKFQRLLGEWKGVVRQLVELRNRPRASGPALIRDDPQYQQLIAEGDALLDQLIVQAEKAFSADPDPRSPVAQFLINVARDLADRDEPAAAARIARLLVDKRAGHFPLVELAGMSLYRSNQFDAAEKYLREAARLGALSQQASQMLAELPESKQAWTHERNLRAAEKKADDLPRVKLHTERGDIVLELFENEAPNTVANFISLVEQGFYDGLAFHQVMRGVMAHAGSPTPDGSGGPGYTIKDERQGKDMRRHFHGSVTMANQGKPNTAGSRFMIMYVPFPQLDERYTVFGRVLEGMDVAAKLRARDGGGNEAWPGDKILKATVLRKRDHPYVPETIPVPKD